MIVEGLGVAHRRVGSHIRPMITRSLGPTHRAGLWRPLLLASVLGVVACQPTVRLEAPQEPIVINLNVKIEQEVRVRVERELDDVIRENQGLF